MPMVPELVIAMLACARIGAIHSVIFGGFSSEAIADRNNDARRARRHGRRRLAPRPASALKANVDEALKKIADGEELHRPQPHRMQVHIQDGRIIGGTI